MDNFKKSYRLELVNGLALEINPTVSGMSNSGRSGNTLVIENTYNKARILSNKIKRYQIKSNLDFNMI
jgi:hypothetical protein